MKNILSNKSGFTLSEILIALQIFSLLILFVYAANRMFYLSYIKQIRQLNKIRTSSYYHQLISEKLNQADRFEFVTNALVAYANEIEVIRFDSYVRMTAISIDDSLQVRSISANLIEIEYKKDMMRFSLD